MTQDEPLSSINTALIEGAILPEITPGRLGNPLIPPISAGDSPTFLMPGAPPPVVVTRVPWGISWLDRLCGGGMDQGDCAAFISPPGSGKTALGVQIAVARARMGMDAIFISYDEPIDAGCVTDLSARFYANATRVSKNRFHGKTGAEWDPEARGKYDEACKTLGAHLRPYDMASNAQGYGGIDDIREVVASESRCGRRPTLIVIDWAWAAVSRFMSRQEALHHAHDPQNPVQAMDEFVGEFAQLCRAEKIQGMILQQIATDSYSGHVVEAHYRNDALCKCLGQYCRFALGAPRLDESGRTQIISARGDMDSGDYPTAFVQLDGELSEFKPVSLFEGEPTVPHPGSAPRAEPPTVRTSR